jgi:ubiquinone/menaquinone biosynthesis C-methylase UbiE
LAPPKSQSHRQQELVDELFDTNATYWRDTYKEKGISGVIYQRRQATALSYIDGLALPKTAHVLEIGCGAGFLTAALVRRGFFVEGIDHAQTMVDLNLEHARQKGIVNRVNVCTGDVHELSYEDKAFDLIIALGVIPWLHDSKKALTEIKRVTKPGGYVVLTMDNALRAPTLLDPKTSPPVALVRSSVRRKLERTGLLSSSIPWPNAPPYNQHTPKEFKKNLCEAGLTIIKSTSVGFGPFTFFGRRLFSEMVGIKIHQKLQEYADSRYPFFLSTGSHYIVLATRKLTKQIR